jgi:hypothetical protein
MNPIAKIALRAGLVLLILLAILYGGDYAFLKYRLARFEGGNKSTGNSGNSGPGSAPNSPPSTSGSSPSAPRGPLDTVQIQRTYEIPHKDGRAEFAFAEPQTVPCVHSIFPHLGYSPCWYLKRHTQQTIPM